MQYGSQNKSFVYTLGRQVLEAILLEYNFKVLILNKFRFLKNCEKLAKQATTNFILRKFE